MASMECDFRNWKLESNDDVDDDDEFFKVDSNVANLASMADVDVDVDDVASNVIFVVAPFDVDDDDDERFSADSCAAILK